MRDNPRRGLTIGQRVESIPLGDEYRPLQDAEPPIRSFNLSSPSASPAR